MRIALDATPLIEPAGGLPRYVTELALALADLEPADEIHLLSDQPDLHIDPRLRERPNVVLTPPAPSILRRKWWSLGLPAELRRRRIDVFHGTNFEIPYVPLTPAVVTVHDLSPWKPDPIRPPGSDRVRARARRLLPLARRILTPSEAVRRELAERFRVDLERIEAIPLAPSPALAPPEPERAAALRRELGVAAPYLLYAGARNPRKNVPLLIDAWRLARARLPSLGLVLAGPPGASPPWEDPALRDVGAVGDEALAALLSGAAAFVYPSSYEGFGLPVLEAMRAGTPVLASRDAALEEVAGGAAVHVDAPSAEPWSDAIIRIVSDDRVADRLRRLGRERASGFGWRLTAERAHAAYERAIRRS